MRTSAYIAASVDGFIARENGDIDWLAGDRDDAGEDYGYGEFFESVDALVMGRHTYEKVLTFGEWPYGRKPVVVLSSRAMDIPERLAGTVEAMAAEPTEVVERLAAGGAEHAYIDGGRTIQAFLAAGALQRLIVTRIPVLIGTGRSLFGPLPADVKLRHVATRAFETGLVQTEYEVVAEQ